MEYYEQYYCISVCLCTSTTFYYNNNKYNTILIPPPTTTVLSLLGVELADQLAHRMGLRSNGVAKSLARRNKYHMGENVRAAGK